MDLVGVEEAGAGDLPVLGLVVEVEESLDAFGSVVFFTFVRFFSFVLLFDFLVVFSFVLVGG